MKKFFAILILMALSFGLKSDARGKSERKKTCRLLIKEIKKYKKIYRIMKFTFGSPLDAITPHSAGDLKAFIEASHLFEVNNLSKKLVKELEEYTASMKNTIFYKEVVGYIQMLNDEEKSLLSDSVVELSDDVFLSLKNQVLTSLKFGGIFVKAYLFRFSMMSRLFKELKMDLDDFQELYQGGLVAYDSSLLERKFNKVFLTLGKLVDCFKQPTTTWVYNPLEF